MKKLIIAAAALFCASALLIQAQDVPAKPAKKPLTPEQKEVMKEMLAKYDTNKDGKLDKTEREAISKEDKEKMAKAGLTHERKKKVDATTTAPATNAPAATTK